MCIAQLYKTTSIECQQSAKLIQNRSSGLRGCILGPTGVQCHLPVDCDFISLPSRHFTGVHAGKCPWIQKKRKKKRNLNRLVTNRARDHLLALCKPALVYGTLRSAQSCTMALRRGLQLLAPRLGDQGARFLGAPLCSQAANLPFHSCDDRSSVGPSGNTGFACGTACLPSVLSQRCGCWTSQRICHAGFSSNSALAPTTSGLPPTQHVMKNPTNIIE